MAVRPATDLFLLTAALAPGGCATLQSIAAPRKVDFAIDTRLDLADFFGRTRATWSNWPLPHEPGSDPDGPHPSPTDGKRFANPERRSAWNSAHSP